MINIQSDSRKIKQGDTFIALRGISSDGFYDAKGNWVNPGGAYYDGKGYLQSATADVSVSNDSDGLPVFLIVLPIVLIGILVISIAGMDSECVPV